MTGFEPVSDLKWVYFKKLEFARIYALACMNGVPPLFDPTLALVIIYIIKVFIKKIILYSGWVGSKGQMG